MNLKAKNDSKSKFRPETFISNIAKKITTTRGANHPVFCFFIPHYPFRFYSPFLPETPYTKNTHEQNAYYLRGHSSFRIAYSYVSFHIGSSFSSLKNQTFFNRYPSLRIPSRSSSFGCITLHLIITVDNIAQLPCVKLLLG